MTQVSILGPPRSGRRVLTEKQALDELTKSGAFESPVGGAMDTGIVSPSGVLAPLSNGVSGVGSSRIEQVTSDTFRFYDVPYQDGVIPCIERPMQYISNKKEKTQKQHFEWLAQAKDHDGWTLADMELEYQMLRISFELRNHPALGPVAAEYIRQARMLFVQWITTADLIEFTPGGINAKIINKGLFTPKPEKQVDIPCYADDYFKLSEPREEKQLYQVNRFDEFTRPFLETFLGQGYANAGAIFSYCSSRTQNQLRDSRIFTPSIMSRTSTPLRAGGFGIDEEGRFDILANDYTHSTGRAIPVKRVLTA